MAIGTDLLSKVRPVVLLAKSIFFPRTLYPCSRRSRPTVIPPNAVNTRASPYGHHAYARKVVSGNCTTRYGQIQENWRQLAGTVCKRRGTRRALPQKQSDVSHSPIGLRSHCPRCHHIRIGRPDYSEPTCTRHPRGCFYSKVGRWSKGVFKENV